MSQTYQVTCQHCGEERWPYVAERPDPYVCMRCAARPPEQQVKRPEHQERARQAALARWAARRARGAPDAPESPTAPA